MRRELAKAVGPPWFCEFSNQQIALLASLKNTIHQDLLDRMPIRTRQALIDIGITCKLPGPVLLKAMDGSEEDPGVFVWNLYSLLYRKLPTELLPSKLQKTYWISNYISCISIYCLSENFWLKLCIQS